MPKSGCPITPTQWWQAQSHTWDTRLLDILPNYQVSVVLADITLRSIPCLRACRLWSDWYQGCRRLHRANSVAICVISLSRAPTATGGTTESWARTLARPSTIFFPCRLPPGRATKNDYQETRFWRAWAFVMVLSHIKAIMFDVSSRPSQTTLDGPHHMRRRDMRHRHVLLLVLDCRRHATHVKSNKRPRLAASFSRVPSSQSRSMSERRICHRTISMSPCSSVFHYSRVGERMTDLSVQSLTGTKRRVAAVRTRRDTSPRVLRRVQQGPVRCGQRQ